MSHATEKKAKPEPQATDYYGTSETRTDGGVALWRFVRLLWTLARAFFWRCVRATCVHWMPKHDFKEHISLGNGMPVGFLSTRGKVIIYGKQWRYMHHFGRIR